VSEWVLEAFSDLCVTKLFLSLQNTTDTKKGDKDKEYMPTNGNTNYQMSRRSKKAKAEDVCYDLVLLTNTIPFCQGIPLDIN